MGVKARALKREPRLMCRRFVAELMAEFVVELAVVLIMVVLRRIARFAGYGYKSIFFNDLDDFAKGYQQAYQQKAGITLHVSGAVRH
jgi:hypothetical protein